MGDRIWLLYAAGWSVIVAMTMAAFLANGLPLGLAVRNAIAYLLPEILLGVPLLRFAPDVLRRGAGARARSAAMHAALLAAFFLLSCVLWVAFVKLDGVLFGSDGGTINLRLIPFRLANDVLVCGACLGIGYALRNAAAARAQAARAARADTLRAQAQLEALRSRINPHFLLNTLHAVLGLVGRDPAAAEEALERLGDLLRYSLAQQREGIDEVPLHEELRFVNDYLDIERLRLGARLRVQVEVSDAARAALVPTFALQTLVENAIEHAIARRAEGGSITIGAETAAARLRMHVTDASSGTAAAVPARGNGIGLRLLGDRLAALYGDAASLCSERAANGLRVTLELPLRAQEHEP